MITFNRGKEFSKWKEIKQESKIPLEIFVIDPGAPGQQGLNKNSNSIVRQDRPKSTDLSIHSQEKLNEITMKYHRVPRRNHEKSNWIRLTHSNCSVCDNYISPDKFSS